MCMVFFLLLPCVHRVALVYIFQCEKQTFIFICIGCAQFFRFQNTLHFDHQMRLNLMSDLQTDNKNQFCLLFHKLLRTYRIQIHMFLDTPTKEGVQLCGYNILCCCCCCRRLVLVGFLIGLR